MSPKRTLLAFGHPGSWFSRIGFKLLAFNILLVILPAAGLSYFRVYERKLLEAQERGMVQQGRLLAAVFAGESDLGANARQILQRLDGRSRARIRVLDASGTTLADSAALGSTRAPGSDVSTGNVRSKLLYRLGQWLFNLYGSLAGLTSKPGSEGIASEGLEVGLPPPAVVQTALEGHYGAAWRPSTGQRSVTLYSALPIRRMGRVTGAVLVSQSTLGVLSDLYDVRLMIFKVILLSLGMAIVLTLLHNRMIAGPLILLRGQALALLDRRGRPGPIPAALARSDEIGDLSRALEELARRLRARIEAMDGLASDISHELKNPLAAIRSATELLGQVDTLDGRVRFIRIIESHVSRMERMLSTLREVTSIDARVESDPRIPIDLARFARSFLEGYGLRSGHQLDFRFREDQGPHRVITSEERLTRILENLLDNAVSFSPPGGRIEMDVSNGGAGGICLRIRDQGPGIPENQLGLIFERFRSYRPSSDLSRHEHMGLGLAIVRAVVEGDGGSVRAVNAPGGGALFEIRFPDDG